MADVLESIQNQIESITLALVTMEGEDIPVLGEMINHLNEIEGNGPAIGEPSFLALTKALSAYLERIILRETADFKPFEAGIEHLQAYCRCLLNDVAFSTDLTEVFSALGAAGVAPAAEEAARDNRVSAEDEAASASLVQNGIPEELTHFDAPSPDLNEEDLEIFSGFVVESLEGLESIEVGLIDLEQNPDDTESINTIFRSFHTIKGVSGFLGLERINKLSHRAENLLDNIRSNEINIDADVTDVILDSVDLLKKMVEGVQQGMNTGSQLDIGIDIVPVVTRIEAIQKIARRGTKPIGEILVEQGSVTSREIESAVSRQKKNPDKKLGQILVEDGAADAR